MDSPAALNVFCYEPGPGADTVGGGHGEANVGLSSVPQALWRGILSGTHPFPATFNREKRLLLVLSRDGVCHCVDPIKVRVDEAGYLTTLDASVTALPNNIIDLRARFIQRYLRRHHAWEPPTAVLLEALVRSGCVLPAATKDHAQYATD